MEALSDIEIIHVCSDRERLGGRLALPTSLED
jgi:hypothetical protein